MNKSSEFLYDNKLRIPEKLLIHTHSQLRFILIDKSNKKSWDVIGGYLNKYFHNEFKEKNIDLYHFFNSLGIGLSAANIERALKGKKGIKKVSVKYELLDFICYAVWEKSLAAKIFDSEFNWDNKIIYDVIISEYAKIEINELLSSNKEINKQVQLKTNAVSEIKDISPDGLIKITSIYWEKYKLIDKSEIINELKYFYINPAFSGGNIIQKVIANNFYTLPNENITIQELSPESQTHENIDKILSKFRNKQNYKCLIKITGFGGCGKTTYLWHLSKQYYEDFETYYLDSFDPDYLKFMSKETPLLLIVDSFYEKNEKYEILSSFFQKLDKFQKVILIVSERSDWFDYFERGIFNISKNFPYIYEIEFINTCINRNEVLNQIIKLLKDNDADFSISDSEKGKLEVILLDDKLSLVEAKYLLLCQLKTNYKFCKHFKFDWEDWMDFIDSNSKYSDLKYLYHFIALFQQYGQKIPVKLNLNTIFNCNNVDFIKINDTIGNFSTDKSPILIDEKFLSIRHDKLGELLIKNLNITEKNIINRYIENYFNNISDTESIYLFRNIHRKNEAFTESPLFEKYLTIEKRIYILENYLNSVPDNSYTENECKCLTELIKSYEEISNKEKMLENINKLIQFEDIYGKHMLAYYYIKNEPSKYAEAEKLLKQLEEKEGHTPIIESVFIKLYRKYKEGKIPDYYNAIFRKEAESDVHIEEEASILMWKANWFLKNNSITDAIKIYNNIIKMHPNDYHSRTKLAQVLRKDALKSKNISLKSNLLKKALRYLLDALSLNDTNVHAYTELGETFFALGNVPEAIKYLELGICNSYNNIACKTTLGKIYIKLSKASKNNGNICEAISYLNKSYKILRECVCNEHIQSSVILAEVCMNFIRLLRDPSNEIIIDKIPNSIEEYFHEIESLLNPIIFDSDGNLNQKKGTINSLKLLLEFYSNSKFYDKFNELSTKIFNQEEVTFDFWFQMLISFNDNGFYITTIFTKFFTSLNNNYDIYKIINKLTNKNYHFVACDISLLNAIKIVKENSKAYLNGTLLSGAYFYSIGLLDRCKDVLITYSKLQSESNKIKIWEEFYKLVTDNRMYINLNIDNAKLLKEREFYFDQAQKIKIMIFSPHTSGIKDQEEITVTGFKYKLNEIHGIFKLKALEKSHEDIFGYECFFIQLVLGQIYKFKRFGTIDNETKLKIAKNYFENAYFLAKNNKFSYVMPSHISKIYQTKAIYSNKNIEKNYFERLLKDLIECYVHIGSETLIKRAVGILNKEKISYPLSCLLFSKIYTKQKEYKLSYDSCQVGIKNFNENIFNPEIHDNPKRMKGELFAELAYSAHKNWKENNIMIGNKDLLKIKSLYISALNLNPHLRWVNLKIKEIESFSKAN